MSRQLDALFENQTYDLKPWLIGKIPNHYKRISVDEAEKMRLAKLGASTMAAAYGVKLFFTQSLIAGAVLDEEYKEIVIVSPSQYGKSWLMGRLGLYRAYQGAKQYIAGAAANVTQIIMGQTISATQEASEDIKKALTMKQNEIDRLTSSVSKQRLAFSTGGFVEAITLGDVYSDNLTANKAVGRAGDFIIDEAALVSEQSFIEMGRREFAKIDGTKYKSIMISNPHKPGFFYDKLTQSNPPEDTFILWMDALTAVEEERFSKETVYHSDFARNKSSLRRYLLCVLDQDGGGMFDLPKTHKKPVNNPHAMSFLGIDSAYKGKDDLYIARTEVDKAGIRVEEVFPLDTHNWIEGVTSSDIIRDVAKVDRAYHVANVCVDTGSGIWLNEGLKLKGVNSHGINFSERPSPWRVKDRVYSATNALNKRAEMHLDLQDFIEHNAISFSEQAYKQIKGAMPYINATRKSNGKIKINDKEEVKAIIKHSPDALDAVLLSLHAMVQYLGDFETPIP